MGLTTNFNKAKKFLEQVKYGEDNPGGIFLLKLDEETGEFREEDFVESKNINQCSLREITQEEIKRELPEKLFVLNANGGYEIEHRIFISEESLLENLGFYHEQYGRLFSSFGSYINNFAAYVLFNNVIEGSWCKPNISFEEAIEDVKLIDDFIIEIKLEEITDLDGMKSIGEIYIPRIKRKNLRKAFDLAKQFIKIVLD
uniref:Uncharacterized protein n=1 Tax=Pithovirus LCPAC401 TaxID=2506595 RepID=A0A481ZBW9_9VIRU|nr:MAG: hypothetical protein LCPAC401_04800 [Pithovirus LCPAC401]